MKKVLVLLGLMLVLTGCVTVVVEDPEEDGLELDVNVEIEEEGRTELDLTRSDESESAEGIIDFDTVAVGDTVGGMTVTEITNPLDEKYEGSSPLEEWNSLISFEGEVELTGEYIYYSSDTAFFGGLVCVTYLEKESEVLVPLPEDYNRTIYMCFENSEDAMDMLGITDDVEETGEFTFVIDYFQYVGIESSVWNWANLVEVK